MLFSNLRKYAQQGIAEILQITDPTLAQINEFLDLGILINDIRIADIVIEENEFQETIVLLQFKDDSTEDSEGYYQSFLDDLEMIYTSYFGSDSQ